MKKYILTLLLSSFALTAKARNLGMEIQAELVYSTYQECNDDSNALDKLAEIIEIPKPQWCGCLISQIQQQFERNQLEQRINKGDITIKQFEQELEDAGEKAGEYCMDKLLKND